MGYIYHIHVYIYIYSIYGSSISFRHYIWDYLNLTIVNNRSETKVHIRGCLKVDDHGRTFRGPDGRSADLPRVRPGKLWCRRVSHGILSTGLPHRRKAMPADRKATPMVCHKSVLTNVVKNLMVFMLTQK